MSVIDYKTWEWQPKIRLTRLTQQEIHRVDERGSESSANKFAHISPIHFDDEESFIREISPKTATKEFQKRMVAIKKSIQPILSKPSDVKFKRVRMKKPLSTHQLEYEATHKRLQRGKSLSNSAKHPTSRRLYNHGNSFNEDIDEHQIRTTPKTSRRRAAE